MAEDIKRILLFSAGMDSYIYKELFGFSNEECLFVKMGTEENVVEEKFIDKYFPGVIKTVLPIAQYELPNKVIPYRNHMLCLLAANYGNTIHFAFTVGDRSEDKDYTFANQMEGILNYFASGPHRVKIPRPYTLHLGTKSKSKTDLVQMYKERGFDLNNLLTKSHSCYFLTEEEKPCGKCHSCIRKYVPLRLSGVDCSNYFMEDPMLYLEDFLIASIKKDRKHEVFEMQQCLALSK